MCPTGIGEVLHTGLKEGNSIAQLTPVEPLEIQLMLLHTDGWIFGCV